MAFGALPLGALAGGLLVQAVGPARAGGITGAAMLVVAALTTAAPSVRRGPASRPERPEVEVEEGSSGP